MSVTSTDNIHRARTRARAIASKDLRRYKEGRENLAVQVVVQAGQRCEGNQWSNQRGLQENKEKLNDERSRPSKVKTSRKLTKERKLAKAKGRVLVCRIGHVIS